MSVNRISRRDALLALGLAAMSEARADGGLLRATRVDHVALAVGDIDKALVFYRSLFGNEVLKDSRTARRYLRLGPCYMAIAPAAAGEAKRIDHIGIGIANFNASPGGFVYPVRSKPPLAAADRGVAGRERSDTRPGRRHDQFRAAH